MAVIAVVLGLRGVTLHDKGLAPSYVPAAIASTLGLAVLVISALLLWTGLGPHP